MYECIMYNIYMFERILTNIFMNRQLYHTWVEPEVYNGVTYAKCAEPYAWPLSRFGFT